MIVESEPNTDRKGKLVQDARSGVFRRFRPAVVIPASLFAVAIVGLNWPCAYVDRSYSKLPEGVSGISGATSHTIKQQSSRVEYVAGFPWGYWTREETSPSQWRPLILFADALIGLGAFVLLTLWWRNRRTRCFQVSIADLLLLLLVTGGAFAYWRSYEQQIRWEGGLSELADVRVLSEQLRYPRWWEACCDEEWIQRYERTTAVSLEKPDRRAMLALAKSASIDTVVIRRGELTTDDLLLLTKLPNLRSLVLQAPGIEVDLPVVLQRLPKLESIELSYMHLTEPDFIALQTHPALRQLCVGRSRLTKASLHRIARFPDLDVLSLPDDCLGWTDLDCLEEHPNLRELAFCVHTGKADDQNRRCTIKDLPCLEALYLPMCIDWIVLEDLPSLRMVKLEYPRPSMDPHMDRTYDKVTPTLQARLDAKYVRLRNLSSLRAISLNPSRLAELHLEAMPNLTAIVLNERLSRNEPTGRATDELSACIVHAFQHCPSLQALDVHDLPMDESVLQMIEACQGLSHLRLMDTPFDDAAAKRIADLPSLASLTIFHQHRRGLVTPTIDVKCPTTLNLAMTEIDTLQLANLPDLQSLHLPSGLTKLLLVDLPRLQSNLVLTRQVAQRVTLRNLPEVRSLDFSNCTVAEADIADLNGLRSVRLEGCRINEEDLRWLRSYLSDSSVVEDVARENGVPLEDAKQIDGGWNASTKGQL